MTIRNVYLDCEFLPADPNPRGLVSIGLCDDRGAEYYAANRTCDWEALIGNEWMRANVVPSLPLRFLPRHPDNAPGALPWTFDNDHPDRGALKRPERIAADLADWFADTDADTTHLWAWYGGQDICRLHSLWNNDWAAMPDQIPRWFNELETLRWQAGEPDMPEQADGEHNALADARHNRTMHDFLRSGCPF
ncbi:MAG TPA: hypothetical protein VHU40_00555 [Polyangia bacterium]|nr:hypothetical protein [Polyangia bacterium]